MNKQELISKLKKLDEEISMVIPSDEKIIITIVGGGALILQGFLNRITLDIDIIDVYSNVLYPILEKYDVNCRSNAFIDCVAEFYYKRLVKIDIETKVVDYYSLSLEDIVIMKLHSSRKKDYVDIRTDEVIKNINWNLLEDIISSGEADVSFNSRRYKEFLDRYNEYKKECCK